MDSNTVRARPASWLPRLIAESAVVIFSVLFALAVDEWRENRSLARQVAQARTAFAEEMAGNDSLLASEWGRPYHARAWDAYKALHNAYRQNNSAQADSITLHIGEIFNTGVHPPPLRDAVWRSLSGSDLIRHMEPREVFLLADIYREQEQLDHAFRRMLDVWLQPSPFKQDPAYKRDDADVTRLFLADVVAAEDRLLKRYKEGLATLRSR
jgi:hypothetical protein